MNPGAETYLPITLKVQGWRCVVVGGGTVAARRVKMLLDAGALVTVVAPSVCESLVRLKESGRIVHLAETYRATHLAGARMVIAATDSPAVNASVGRDARNAEVLLNDTDEPSGGDFTVPAVVRRGDLILAVTTLGATPTLAKSIRDDLAARYGPEWETYVTLLGEMRQRVLATVDEADRRKVALNALAGDSTLLELIREGRTDEARTRALSCISPLSD